MSAAPSAAGAAASRDGSVKSSRGDRPSRSESQPPLFGSEPTVESRRAPTRRAPARADHPEEVAMERDRTRRPLFELDQVPQAAKIKVIGLGGGGGNAVS